MWGAGAEGQRGREEALRGGEDAHAGQRRGASSACGGKAAVRDCACARRCAAAQTDGAYHVEYLCIDAPRRKKRDEARHETNLRGRASRVKAGTATFAHLFIFNV